MASSTPPHYSITAAKPQHSAHPTPHSTLQKHQQSRRRSSHRIQSSASLGSSATSSNAVTNVAAATSTPIASTASVRSGSGPGPSPHKNGILGRNPEFLHYYSQPEAGLTRDFRQSRTTKVISKRNLSSPKSSHGYPRTGSPAAARCLTQILRSGPSDRALGNILMGFGPDLGIPEDYCYILHELGNQDRCPSKALGFFYSSISSMRNPTEQGKLLTAAIGALGRMGRPDLARQIFDVGITLGYANTVFAHSALISAYARSGLAAEAVDILEMMKTAGLKPTTISYNALIDACGKGGVDLKLTLGFFREMLHSGLYPDRKTFNSLLAACSRAGHLEDARMVFDEMLHLGIGQDIYTYNTFIDAICKCGNMDLALQVMFDMPINNVEPNIVTYSTLMDGYSKLEQFDDALSLYEKMKALKIGLDRICYNTLLSIYAKTGKYAEIAKVCEEMETTGVDKDIVSYNCLINGYGKQGRFDIVAHLVQDMRERGVTPTILTYSTLIDVYSKAGMYGDAANVFFGFKESGLKADVVLYSSFIDILAKNGLVDCSVWLLDEMMRTGIEPNVVTYNTIIDAFGKSRIVHEGDGVGNELEGGGAGSQIVGAFCHVTRGIGPPAVEESRRSEELLCILGLFQKMVQQGVRPNVVTFSAILNACSRCNSFEDASLLLDQLRLFDNFTYGVAHGLLMGSKEVWVHAQSLFDELRQMDPATSSAFYNALTDMLWHFGQRRGAQHVVTEGVRRHVWENTWTEDSLDLHLMSVGAAQAMVHAWLLTTQAIVFEGRKLPEILSILTGWGKHSKVPGASTLRHVIKALLNSIGAPFHLEKFNIGRFVSAGATLAAWLRESSTLNILLLRDERAQSDSSSNVLPRLQALQL
ncbi:pentatricopeptide repeat-containing protein At2g31400, chloroplastic-like [Zingiber officinale]|uniref:pentatricopeptide repeat-containing protein At2g31400, chloroplastic-like n=1 Tax=Zingiber officinale TaxID=94328 RepID=UPI001C4D0E51|nr:pentatricopeptide repeat-containing protein At2g31400, chloroplastic-like [Zingiber officinale]